MEHFQVICFMLHLVLPGKAYASLLQTNMGRGPPVFEAVRECERCGVDGLVPICSSLEDSAVAPSSEFQARVSTGTDRNR